MLFFALGFVVSFPVAGFFGFLLSSLLARLMPGFDGSFTVLTYGMATGVGFLLGWASTRIK